jgi:hypothetical protein
MKPLHVFYEREPAGSLSSPAGFARGLLSLLQKEGLI